MSDARLSTTLGLAAAILSMAASRAPAQESERLQRRLEAQVRSLQRELAEFRVRIRDLEYENSALTGALRQLRGMQVLGDVVTTGQRRSVLKIRDVSGAPDPAASDYPDCMTVVRAEIVRAAPGLPEAETILVGLLVMRERKLTPPVSELSAGDFVSVVLFPRDAVDESVQTTQTINTIEDYESPFLYGADARRVSMESVEVVRPALESRAQDAAIASDLATIRARLAEHGGDWDAWQASLEPWRSHLAGALGENGGPLDWRGRATFRSLERLEPRPEMQWPGPQIEVLTSLRDQLAKAGIDLIIAPFPVKEHVTGAKFWGAQPPPHGVLDAQRERLYASLLEAGLEVIDARQVLIEALDDFPHVYYDGGDGHPADGAIQTVARLIAARVWRYEFERDFKASNVESVRFRVPPRFEKFPDRAHRDPIYTATIVTEADGTELQMPRPDSPLLVIGDSTAHVPTGYGVSDANVAAHLAKEVGVVPKRAYLSGGAPRMVPFLARQDPALFRGVRVCVFVLNERFLRIHDTASLQSMWHDERLENLGL